MTNPVTCISVYHRHPVTLLGFPLFQKLSSVADCCLAFCCWVYKEASVWSESHANEVKPSKHQNESTSCIDLCSYDVCGLCCYFRQRPVGWWIW